MPSSEQLRRLEPDVGEVYGVWVDAVRVEDGEEVGRHGVAIADPLARPVGGRVDAGAGEADPALLSLLADERDGDDRQGGVGAALEHDRGVGGRDLDAILRDELKVAAAAFRVLDGDGEPLVAEKALLLRDISADERQVRLRAEAGEER